MSPPLDPHLTRHITAQDAGKFAPGFQPPARTSPLLDPYTPLSPPTTMHPETHRRAALGLAILGPFSRNRRRSLREAAPACLATGLILGLILFLAALFS